MNDLVIIEKNGQESIIPAEELKKYLAPTATDQEMWMFLGLAKAYNLNPFKREIHFVKYGQGDGAKAQVIIGYEVYLKRAMETGKLEWWKAEIEGTNASDMKAIFKAKRNDWSEEFTWEVNRSEFDKGQSTWRTMPKFMLKKCAISQGLRLLFPEELGGMPYSPEEINGHTSEQINNSSVIDVEVEEVKEKIEPETDEEANVVANILKKIEGFKTEKSFDNWSGLNLKHLADSKMKESSKEMIKKAIQVKKASFQPEGPITKDEMNKWELSVWQGKMDELKSLEELVKWSDVHYEAINANDQRDEILAYMAEREKTLRELEGNEKEPGLI